MVSYDSDYHSPLDDKKLKEFLQQEWNTEKQSELHFYKKLSEFFKENFPEINLELIRTERQKDDLVQSLLESPNYATTHVLIAKLSEYNEFTEKQLEGLVDALLLNGQVRRIAEDPDVKEFYESLYKNYDFSFLESGKKEKMMNLFVLSGIMPF